MNDMNNVPGTLAGEGSLMSGKLLAEIDLPRASATKRELTYRTGTMPKHRAKTCA